MESNNEKIEYGKTEIKENGRLLKEVKAVQEGVEQDDLLDKKKSIKKDPAFKKSDAIRE